MSGVIFRPGRPSNTYIIQSGSTGQLGKTRDPQHVIDISKRQPPAAPVVIYRGGGSEEIAQNIKAAYLRLLTKAELGSISPPLTGPLALKELTGTSKGYITNTLHSNPSLIIFVIENKKDLEAADRIIELKKALNATTRIILIGKRADKEHLDLNPEVVLDFFESENINPFPLNRFSVRMEAGVETWLRHQLDRQQFMEYTIAFLRTINARDPYTAGHCQRVAAYAMAVAKLMNIPPHEVLMLKAAGLLHDIGKIGIRDAILLKPDRLTEEEFTTMKTHPLFAVDQLEAVGELAGQRKIIDMIRFHHERPDGGGYPTGKTLQQLCLTDLILPSVDAFDAMTSNRVYQRAMTVERALFILSQNRGTQFHPLVEEAVETMAEEGIVITCDDLTPSFLRSTRV